MSDKNRGLKCPQCLSRIIKIYRHKSKGNNYEFKPLENVFYCEDCNLIYNNGERIAL